MNINKLELAKKLKKTREENLLTVEELATRSGLDVETILDYEGGQAEKIDITSLECLAKSLNVEISSLTGWKGDSLGEIIRYRRKELGMTQKDIASYVNVSHSAVSRWESGEIENITQDKIAGLADILELSPLTLIAPNSNNSLYQIQQDYLDVARKLQLLNIPADICEEIIDIIERLRRSDIQ